jgi:hypothetical protein
MITYKKDIKGFDHIAFRSLEEKHVINAQNLKRQDDIYEFPKYNSRAVWFKLYNSRLNFKRIFASYYLGVDNDRNLNKDDKKTVRFVLNNPSGKMSYELYQRIHNKNQYLAWTLVHGHKINHVAIAVSDIKRLVDQLKRDGYELNEVNNKMIHTGLDGKLLQASIKSDLVNYQFNDGVYMIPGSYVEFVQRIDNIDGFNNENASKIMDSTKVGI